MITELPQSGLRPRGGATAPLLFWLLVVTGLAGVTVLRFEEPDLLGQLWFASVVGIAAGQISALFRLRIWFVVVMSAGLWWFAVPLVYSSLVLMFGAGSANAVALMLVPALICGYASLSERGGLLAFWYPAMLWMLVILDGENDAFTAGATLPFVIGLGVLFVAFLRARETRRVALWRRYAHARLATPAPRTVLFASPSRRAAELAWTAFVAGGALALAAWVAPLLWQKEEARHAQSLAITPPVAHDAETGLPCCAEPPPESRVKEFVPLKSQARAPQATEMCVTCRARTAPSSTWEWSYDGTPGAGLSGTIGEANPGWSHGSDGTFSYGGGGYASTPSSAPPMATGGEAEGAGAASGTSATTGGLPASEPAAAAMPEETPTPTPTADPAPTAAGRTPTATPAIKVASAPPPSGTSPIAGLFFVALGGLALHLGYRATRRALTLRHLERPFWNEPLDQQVSNHWERMLVGLEDAGIYPGKGEQPQAFARRVGIEGMKTCATILERVRHGVRVDADDLRAMHDGASTVYQSARGRAGLPGRIAATLRWPLTVER